MEEHKGLRLRPATLEDADRLLRWRNDPETRRRSRRKGPVDPDRHIQWLTAALADEHLRIFIAEEDARPVGTVRAERIEDVWELSWTVAPEARGCGVGSRMVVLLAHQIRGPIRAEMQADHAASARIAEKAGMTYDRTDGEIAHYSRPSADGAVSDFEPGDG